MTQSTTQTATTVVGVTDEMTTSSQMAQLMAEHQEFPIPLVGETLEGKVISSSKNEVHIDINGIVSGVVRGPELFDESGEFTNLKTDDIVLATVLELENENGEVELSFRTAGHQKAWDNLKEMVRSQKIVDCVITDANKGGLIIRVGNVSGFLPVSQLSIEHYPRVEGGNKNRILERLLEYVSSTFRVKVIDIDEIENKMIVSEKVAMAEEQQEKISQYEVGTAVEGKVTGVVDFGAFIEFGEGLEGLVHISEIAWQRIDDPRDYLSVGQMVKAKIISIDDSKISLSIRALEDDPWSHVQEKYKIGSTVEGEVLKVNPFGAFVELDNEIHGLAHISELSYKKLSSPTEVVKEGERHSFKIISIEPHEHRLGLSYKQLHEKPAQTEVSAEATETPSKEADSTEVSAEQKSTEPVVESAVEEPKPESAPEEAVSEETMSEAKETVEDKNESQA